MGERWNLTSLRKDISRLVAGGKDQPHVKYTAHDQNVAAGETTQYTFNAEPVGGLPQGAQVLSGSWAVRGEPDAPSPPNALCQTGTAQFPAITLSEAIYADVVVSVRFKPISGKQDQAGGIIFRVQDKDNYYILRANALEGNVILYKYESGRRSALKRASAGVRSGQWQDLRVEAAGNHLVGFLNGQRVVEVLDDNYQAGKVGLWTKADSVTCFDDVEITAK